MAPRSAKSLFRAISGNGLQSTPALQLFPDAPIASKAMADQRRPDDFYPTLGADPIRGLLACDWDAIQNCGSVWEPACGDGAMVREIRRAGIPCIASDLIDRGCPDSQVRSFYDYAHSPARAIITNPPYCEINSRDGHGRWLRHTLDMPGWDYLALLLSWDWPAARANGLGALLDANPFSYCYLMRWKIDFTGEGSPPQRNAWFVWRRDWSGRSEFRFMNREDGELLSQASLFGGVA